jgi:hypothetical protein
MGLIDIQFREALREASIKILKEGKVPSLSRTVKEIQKRLSGEVATPTGKFRNQNRRAQWDLAGMNSFMTELDFDLKVMYKSLLELSNRVLKRLNLVETSTRAQHAQMDNIEGTARNLLFVIQNGDGHFNAFYDDFHDYSKINLERTTRDAVDLKSQTLELPDASPNTRKISLEHLHNTNAWAYDVNANSEIIRSETPDDALFKNIFLDTVSMWRHDVITREAGPTSLSFEIPVHRITGGEISISRIQVTGVSEHTQQIEVTYSIDGINFLVFPNTPTIVELDKSSRAVNIDFPLTRVEFLRFKLYRSNHDKIIEAGYLTSFGLRNISLYSIGRSFGAELTSKVFTIPEGERLDKLALSVFEEIPQGTDIKYYLATIDNETIDDDQALTDGQWIPITPTNRLRKKDEPTRLIRISTLSEKTLDYIPKSPVTYQIEHKGQKFYPLNMATDTATPEKITDDIVFKTASLQRGKNAWLRKKTGEELLFNVVGNFISFSTGTRQKLYTISQETVGFGTPLTFNNIERSTLEVTRPIDYRYGAGMSVVPPVNVDPYSVPDPLHSIYEVSLTTPSQEYEEIVIMPTTSGGRYKLTKAPIEIEESQTEIEYLSAFRPNLGVHDDELIAALEARTGLSDFHGNTIKSMVSLSTPADVAAGKPQLTRFVIGNDDSSSVVQNRTLDGEVIETIAMPAPSRRAYGELSDDQILALFGRVKFRTKFIRGIRAEGVVDPTRMYLPGEHFEITLIKDPTTGIEDLYVSIAPANPARAISIAPGESVRFKFKYKKNLIQHVIAIDGNRVYLDRKFDDFTNANSGFRVKIGYRFTPVGTNEVLGNTLVVSSVIGGTPYIQGKDYHFNPRDGTITQIPSGKITTSNGKTVAYASFTHKGALNSLETFSAWVFVSSRDPIKIHYPIIEIDSEFGEKILISTGNGSLVDISGTTETPELEYGWHQVLVHSRDPDVFSGTAIRKVAELLDLSGQPVFMAGGNNFSALVGTRVPLTQVPIDFMLNSIVPTDHSKFAIDATGHLIVNFQPNTQQDFYTYGLRLTGSGSQLENEAQYYDEEFRLKYSYHRDEARTIYGVLFKTVLSRGRDTNDSITPKLNGYQIRLA